MKMEFLLAGETPAKKNSRITLKNGKTIPSARFRGWHGGAVMSLRAQAAGVPGLPVSSACVVRAKFVHGDLRRRDCDNGLSSVLDALVDAGVLADDNWRIVAAVSASNLYEKGNPRCEVAIEL